MKRSQSEVRISLTARAADQATEVFITDGSFQRIADGVGQVQIDVTPGIYKVRFRSGDEQSDRLIAVREEDGAITVEGRPVLFHSPVPIVETSTADSDHASAAADAAQAPPRSLGTGSQLLLFTRDTLSPAEPWVGISVHDVYGEPIAHMSEGSSDADEAWGALHLELDAGTYRIRVDTGEIGTFEMFAVTRSGWQTQVFLLSEEFRIGSDSIRRASLKHASVLMTREDSGFSAEDRQIRLTDLARQGLASKRPIARSADLHDMLWAKYENPMLGIYGAHLLLLRPPINHDLVETVMHNLRRLVGSHPDVEALELRPGASTPPKSLKFPTPPMLDSSWGLISRGTRRRASLVPPESVTDAIADELLVSAPWLLHRVDRIDERSREPVSIAAATRIVDSLLDDAASGRAMPMVDVIRAQPDEFSALEQSIASSTMGAGFAGEETPTELLPTAEQAMRNIDAPASAIARSTASLIKKLEELS